MFKIMVIRIIPMPMATVMTKTVLSLPIKGRVVIAWPGRIQTASRISSNPKTLPNRNPKMVEKNPHIPKHKAEKEGVGEPD